MLICTWKKIKNFINKINLDITHIHANNFGIADLNGNPTVVEITFENNPKKLVKILNYQTN